MRTARNRRMRGWITALLIAGLTASAGAQTRDVELRGVWVDAFHEGFKSTTQINSLISRAVSGRYNAIFVEVLAYHDRTGGGHGAYWNSSILPKATDISGGIDPLATLVPSAHAAGLEVHAWVVPFRACTSWPPSGNTTLSAHPEWLMVPLANIGTTATIGGVYTLDPGSPDVQGYLISIARELVTNYAIDGLHWDYIRYTQTDAGYPARTWYTNSGLERFKRITGYVGTPPADNTSWNDFRRREINELVRRALPEIHTITINPQQPLRHSAAVFATGDAPASFTSSDAYGLFQDWKTWMQKAWLDAAVPMDYKREHCTNEAEWYRSWVDAAAVWIYDRHLFCGQGNYLNTTANSVTQMQYAFDHGADGVVNFSYYATRSTEGLCDGTDNWVNDWTWYTYVAANLFTTTATTPPMSWYDPAVSTRGTVYGRVTDGATGTPLDNATFLVNGFTTDVRTDGNGYYCYTLINTGSTGITTGFGARYTGYADVLRTGVRVLPGQFTEVNLALGTWKDGDYDVDGDVDLTDFAEFSPCLTGPSGGPPLPGCDLFDFDADSDVDLVDFTVFQGSFGS